MHEVKKTRLNLSIMINLPLTHVIINDTGLEFQVLGTSKLYYGPRGEGGH